MNLRLKFLLSVLVVILQGCFVTVFGQSTSVFKLTPYTFTNQEVFKGMSDNGQWGVAGGVSGEDSTHELYPKLVNLDTEEVTDLAEGLTSVISVSVSDVTDDGATVVGSLNFKPAYWSASSKSWTTLPVDKAWTSGCVTAVTPDGHYAVGYYYVGEAFESAPAMWDLTTNAIVPLSNMPTKDMSHEDKRQMTLNGISADGRYLLGCMSFSYLPTGQDAGGCCYFVYNRDIASYRMIGFTENDLQPWTPLSEGLAVIMDASMSVGGDYVTGLAYVTKPIVGSEWGAEYEVPFLYNVQTSAFSMYDNTDDMGLSGFAATSNGCVLGATPTNSPIREWSIRNGKYWYAISQVLKQRFDYNYYEKSGFDNTGTAIAINNEGTRVMVMVDPYTCYVLDLPESVSEACKGVNLMGNYMVAPAAGSVVSALKNITLTFDRNITVTGASNAVQIQDETGAVVYTSVGFTSEGSNVNIRFRKGTLTAGKNYRLFIPKGTIAMTSDGSQQNLDIVFPYTGRANEPIDMVQAYPADGSTFAKIDYETNPVLLTFSAPVALTDTASAVLYRNDEEEPFCTLTLATKDCSLALYPATTQYLYNGSTYRLELAAGSVTDVAGNNGNLKIALQYNGNYVREISYDDKVLFSDNMNSGLANFMLYDGDHLTPAQTPASWGFDANNTPWWVARDDEGSDMAATSHSMYSPAGQSDDWMVIPQLYVPDMLCSLSFKSQSYLFSKKDVLKVYVWPCNEVYNSINKSLAQKIRTEGTLVYSELQTPGATEEKLAGEWTDNTVSLADFAGKNVYIAFVNDNENQSAIFVDDVKVEHNMYFLVSLDVENQVVAQSDIQIKGRILVDGADKNYATVHLTLKDAQGAVIDEINATELNLKKGDSYDFAFAKNLPLKVGVANAYSVLVQLDEDVNEVASSILNNAFKTTKRVVLEEFTGRGCGNCPLGITAIENIEKRFGDLFIPIALHAFSDDPYQQGITAYASALGFSVAPSGIVNRGVISMPGVSRGEHVYFTKADLQEPDADKLWMDYVTDEINAGSIVDVQAEVSYNESASSFDVPCKVRYALDADRQNVNVLAVLVEDNLKSVYQENYFAATSYPELPDWIVGGKYGQKYVLDYVYQDVARAAYGLTFNGTGGYLPQTVKAGEDYSFALNLTAPDYIADVNNCKVVVMLIDANTDKVINAVCAKIGGNTGLASSEIAGVTVSAVGDAVVVKGVATKSVCVTSIDGKVLGTATGEGQQNVNVAGYRGVAVVKVISGNLVIVKKVVL